MKTNRIIKSYIGLFLIRLSIIITLAFIILFIGLIFYKGIKVLNIGFIINFPEDGMTKGGILPAILGTFYLTISALIFAFPIGVLSAIFLVEYAKPKWLVNAIRMAINTLAGVPSIVFGLFGLAFFCVFLNFGASILAGSLTLAILILPIIINTSEEAIKSVPNEFREASLALGATKRQTIMKVIIPTALPNILTGAIISVGRASGETAPIIFTAACFYSLRLPSSIFDQCMALPYHIYALMTEGTAPKFQVPIAYGTAIILLLLVLGINTLAIILRFLLRRNKKW